MLTVQSKPNITTRRSIVVEKERRKKREIEKRSEKSYLRF
jgi:hypothetical protein